MKRKLGSRRNVRLGDCAEIVTGFAFKSKDFTDDPNDIHLIKGADVQQGYINWEGCKHWPQEDAANFAKFRLVEGDVVLAMDGPWVPAGLKWAWIKRGVPAALLVQRASRLRGQDSLLTDYLRYLVASPRFEDYIRPIVTGVSVPNISAKQIADFPIQLPDLECQAKINDILLPSDDLIESILRRIQILEEIPENLYSEWFVKFRFPGHEYVRTVDSPLGNIPAGWEVTTLGKHLAKLESGKRPKGGVGNLVSGIASVGAENVVRIGVHNYQNEKFVTNGFFESVNRGVVQDKDVALYKDGAHIDRSTYFRDGYPHADFCV